MTRSTTATKRVIEAAAEAIDRYPESAARVRAIAEDLDSTQTLEELAAQDNVPAKEVLAYEAAILAAGVPGLLPLVPAIVAVALAHQSLAPLHIPVSKSNEKATGAVAVVHAHERSSKRRTRSR